MFLLGLGPHRSGEKLYRPGTFWRPHPEKRLERSKKGLQENGQEVLSTPFILRSRGGPGKNGSNKRIFSAIITVNADFENENRLPKASKTDFVNSK